MKKLDLFCIGFLLPFCCLAQLLPGTLQIQGTPQLVQDATDLAQEAGASEVLFPVESASDAFIIEYLLDPSSDFLGNTISSEQQCENNIYRYKVFVHWDLPVDEEEFPVAIRTFQDSGIPYPPQIPYDNSIVQPLGPRGLTPENGGAYIPVPTDGSKAIKIFEFIGCRTDIPLQISTLPGVMSQGGLQNVNLVITVVGSTL